MKERRSVFLQLYGLAQKENYDPKCWKELLVGAYRSAETKRSSKDICQLFYALSKASRNDVIASLSITCRTTREDNTKITIGIENIRDAYKWQIEELIKYMRSDQLAMLARSLMMMKALDVSLCSVIINRIAYTRLKATPRTLSSLTLTLAKSELMAVDALQTLLLDRMDCLRYANKLDTLELCKAAIRLNIRNSVLSDVINAKLADFSSTLSPSELLLTLSWLRATESKDTNLIQHLHPVLRTHLDKYELKDICFVSKVLIALKPEYYRGLFLIYMNPVVKELLSNNRMKANVDHILQYNLAAAIARCEMSLTSLLTTLDLLNTMERWIQLFRVLHQHQSNLGLLPISYINTVTMDAGVPSTSAIHLNTIEELDLSWKRALEIFSNWLELSASDTKGIAIATEILVNSARLTTELSNKLCSKPVKEPKAFATDVLVDLAYHTHAVPGFNMDMFIELLLEREDEYRIKDCVKVLAMQFALSLDITAGLVDRIRDWMKVADKGAREQEESWMIQELDIARDNTFIHDPSITEVYHETREALSYLLASMVLCQEVSKDNNDYTIKEQYIDISKQHLQTYKTDIINIIKMLNSECRWLQRIIGCISMLDSSILDDVNPHQNSGRYRLESFTMEQKGECIAAGTTIKELVITSGNLSSKVATMNLGNLNYAFINKSQVSNNWDTVWIRIMELILQKEGYTVVEFDQKLETVIADLGVSTPPPV